MSSSSHSYAFLLAAIGLLVAVSQSALVPQTILGKSSAKENGIDLVAPVFDADLKAPVLSTAPVKAADQPELFQGDMAGIDIDYLKETGILRDKASGHNRNGVVEPRKRWYGGAVFYSLTGSFTQAELSLLQGAMKEYEKTGAVRFYPRRSGDANYVNIVRGTQNSGCWSYVGVVGGKQDLNLGAGPQNSAHCLHHGVMVHEMMHAVGFEHEQARTDRDDFVEMNWPNIPEQYKYAFNTYASSYITGFGQPYDYTSVMHYEWNAFAINPRVWTIRAKPPNQNAVLGQNKGLSAIDIKKLDAMYPLCGKLYDGYNGAGSPIILVSGNGYGVMNPTSSSAVVTRGCKMTLCQTDNYAGNCITLTPTSTLTSFPDFRKLESAGWDKSAKSVSCTC